MATGRAVVLALAGRMDQAREAAEEAGRLADRLHYPVGEAATAEAAGACASDPAEQDRLMSEAGGNWRRLGRPLDAARCTLVHGRLVAERDPERSAAFLAEAAAEYDRLGVPGLAGRARELIPVG